jgi:hypothetical protein
VPYVPSGGTQRIKIAFGGVALGLSIFVHHPLVGRSRRRRAAVYVAVAALSLSALYYRGVVYRNSDWGFPNLPELFHYQLGSKYFPELGYEDLYLASLAAQQQSEPGRLVGSWMRGLRTNELISGEEADDGVTGLRQGRIGRRVVRKARGTRAFRGEQRDRDR